MNYELPRARDPAGAPELRVVEQLIGNKGNLPIQQRRRCWVMALDEVVDIAAIAHRAARPHKAHVMGCAVSKRSITIAVVDSGCRNSSSSRLIHFTPGPKRSSKMGLLMSKAKG